MSGTNLLERGPEPKRGLGAAPQERGGAGGPREGPSCPSGAANKKRKEEWCGACAAKNFVYPFYAELEVNEVRCGACAAGNQVVPSKKIIVAMVRRTKLYIIDS